MIYRFLYSVIMLGSLLVGTVSLAANDFGLEATGKDAGYVSPGAPTTVNEIVQRVINILLSLLAIVFFALITYSGLRWMTARGNEEQVESARGTIEAAIIGLSLILLSYGITSFVFRLIAK